MWDHDYSATFLMTDKIHLFEGKSKDVNYKTIQFGGGSLTSSYRGTVVVKCADGSSGVANDVLNVPNLDVSFLSAK